MSASVVSLDEALILQDAEEMERRVHLRCNDCRVELPPSPSSLMGNKVWCQRCTNYNFSAYMLSPQGRGAN